MNILSDYRKDVRRSLHESGGYEWWYFDGISDDNRYSFVIIFYEGNPFSTRYNARLRNSTTNPMPTEHPAVSIAIYEDDEPIYYSFTEYEPKECFFSEDHPMVGVGDHQMEERREGGELKYNLNLEEILPNGDELKAEFTFKSSLGNNRLLESQQDNTSGHQWNLVQSRAEVSANLWLYDQQDKEREISFQGRGYHDHNSGREPMWKEFEDWYWGRFHFESTTLIYYLVNRQNEKQHQGWIVNNKNNEILERFDSIALADKGLNIFGLKSARKIGLQSDRAEVQIQQEQLLDNGPFYQRFKSNAFLRIEEQNAVESQIGISEYIHPDRITSRLFWPLVNMRIHYKSKGPHWVQKSKTLYEWTW